MSTENMLWQKGMGFITHLSSAVGKKGVCIPFVSCQISNRVYSPGLLTSMDICRLLLGMMIDFVEIL